LPNDGAKRRALAQGRVQRDGVVVAFFGVAAVAWLARMGAGVVAMAGEGRRGGNSGHACHVNVLEWGRAGVSHAGERLG
jgi:hypothetical protein